MSKLKFSDAPTLKEVQQYTLDMERERGFADEHVSGKCLLLVEEVGELVKAIRKSHFGIAQDVNKKYEHDVEGEIADILIVLNCIANKLGVDVEQALRDKEEKNKKRVWK
ncbi:MAG TPA: MazG nucleotide pyrophosphohydrolase domain-containing protein [Candidatus Saccharimonadales bacterium]|nr:MazG nucleotide pyrophosphohydrolase domain-containing protein [Candidatus Saccharimonadales bacterium]